MIKSTLRSLFICMVLISLTSDLQAARAKSSQKGNATSLYSAVKSGNLETVKTMVDKGVNINTRDPKGSSMTPLHAAIYYRHPEIARYLVQNGANLEARTRKGSTPLWVAVKDYQPNLELVKFLVLSGADVNAKVKGTHRFVSSTDFRVSNKVIMNPLLHWAIYADKTEIALFLIDHGADIESKDGLGNSPLHIAAGRNNVMVAKRLLEKGANIDSRDGQMGTPLFFACGGGDNREMVDFLLANGADINAKDSFQASPLHFAIANEAFSVAKKLVRRGADVNATSSSKMAPLHWAVDKGNYPMVKLLLDQGADPNNADNSFNTTPLHVLVIIHQHLFAGNTLIGEAPKKKEEILRILQYLLKHGANPNARSAISEYPGATPLHLAVIYKTPEVAKYLQAHGGNPNLRLQNGKTAAQVVRSENMRSIFGGILLGGLCLMAAD